MSRVFVIAMAILAIGLVLLVVNHDRGSVLGIDSSNFGRLVQLGALAVVFGAAVLLRPRLPGTLRHVAIWLAILLLLVAGYQYRFELQALASGLTGGLVAPPPPADPGPGGINI